MRSGSGWQKGGLQGRSARSRPLSAQRATLVSAHALARRSRAAPHSRYDDVFERSLHQSHTLLSSLNSSIYPRSRQGTEVLLCSGLGGRRRCECCAESDDRAGLPEHQRLGAASSSGGGGGAAAGGSSSSRSPHGSSHAAHSDSPQAAGGLHTVSPAAAAAQSAQHLRDDAVAAIRSSGRSVPTSLAAVSVSGSNDASFDEFDASVSGGAAAAAGSGEKTEPELPEPEVRLRLKRAGDLLRMVHVMAPADPGDYNRALIIWRAIRDVPEALRHKLLDVVSASDITRLWQTSQQRGNASGAAAAAAIGPMYSQWDDFPAVPGEVAVFEGKAAVPLAGLAGAVGADRFRKMFFLHPDSEELLGRVDLGYGAAGAAIFPLYYRAAIGSSVVPATGELADMQLDYVEPAALSLSKQDLPNASWPRPKPPRWPFSGGLSDYMRAVGPGVYVGAGWRAPRPEKRDVGRRFLTFLLIRCPQ